jgi:hypothetical protein
VICPDTYFLGYVENKGHCSVGSFKESQRTDIQHYRQLGLSKIAEPAYAIEYPIKLVHQFFVSSNELAGCLLRQRNVEHIVNRVVLLDSKSEGGSCDSLGVAQPKF